MLNQGKITQEEFDDAYNQPLYLNTESEEEYTGEPVYSYFIDALIDNVTDALMEEYAVDRAVASRMLYSGGLKIVSTENPIVQSAMEEVFTDENCFPKTNGHPAAVGDGRDGPPHRLCARAWSAAAARKP